MGLAEQLGIECYEHRLLALASENTGLDEDMLNHYDEKIHGSMLINRLGKAVSELGLRPMTGEFRANGDQKLTESNIRITVVSG